MCTLSMHGSKEGVVRVCVWGGGAVKCFFGGGVHIDNSGGKAP